MNPEDLGPWCLCLAHRGKEVLTVLPKTMPYGPSSLNANSREPAWEWFPKRLMASGHGFSAMSTIVKKINRSSVTSIFCLLTLTSGSQTSQQISTETSMRETCHLNRFPILYEQLYLLKRKEKNFVLPMFSVSKYNID